MLAGVLHSGSKGACALGVWEELLEFAHYRLGRDRNPAPAQAAQVAGVIGSV